MPPSLLGIVLVSGSDVASGGCMRMLEGSMSGFKRFSSKKLHSCMLILIFPLNGWFLVVGLVFKESLVHGCQKFVQGRRIAVIPFFGRRMPKKYAFGGFGIKFVSMIDVNKSCAPKLFFEVSLT